ncbi:MAG: Gldg family protein [Pirellulaceae bacterium]|nr:Gldg family protein [Planctomycetales bacterium]
MDPLTSFMLLLVKLLLIDAVLVGVLVILLVPFAMYKPAALAILKRNFLGYFSNPTGYVFIFLFVVLSSVAAFWSQDFFNANLATLDQLNSKFPLIMLVFIPAITMSIWSEERREGTDELLLTIPASDVDIVVGKYFAAASIFTASLLFSQIASYCMLGSLAMGDLDLGLFITTYVGYWMIGMAMLAIGMAASYLTGNLTVAFILGALFNAPLVALQWADRLTAGEGTAQSMSWWSFAARFNDFGRGVVSFSSSVFFVGLIAFGVYLCVVLIGRRHWSGGRDGSSLFGHYLIRSVSLALLAIMGTLLIYNVGWMNRARYDFTSEKINSLAPDTVRLLKELKPEHPVQIEAFLSKTVPEQYVKTKVDLKNALEEFKAIAGDDVRVVVHDNLEPFTDDAARAEEQYGIEAQDLVVESRGGISQETIYLGAAVTSGLERKIIPFFDRGIPVEYELIRSVLTVTRGAKQRVGVVKTDAEMFGGFDMMRMQQREKQLIVSELEKQYEVEEVDLTNPIVEGKFDMLLVVQPSSLPQPQLNNLITAIRNGQPAAIFEDPFPVALGNAPGTGEARRPQGNMMFGGGQPPEPKGDIRQLWSLLGIEMVGRPQPMGGMFDADVIWQDYNPYENLVQVAQITKEWVFVGDGAPGASDPLSKEQAITSGLNQMLFLFPGAVENMGTAKGLSFEPLVTTGDSTGTISMEALRSGQMDPRLLAFQRKASRKRYVLAARIQGTLKDDLTMSAAGAQLATAAAMGAGQDASGETEDSKPPSDSEENKDAEKSSGDKEINVVYVSDIDLLHSDFLSIRARPDDAIPWQFDNVTFVLNVVDSLVGHSDLVTIRKRQPHHSTLKLVDSKTENARKDAQNEMETYEENFKKERDDIEKDLKKRATELTNELNELVAKAQQGEEVDRRRFVELQQRIQIEEEQANKRLDAKVKSLREERDRKLRSIQRNLNSEVRRVQNVYKMMAVGLPAVPPLLIGLLVFGVRLTREREGISAERLR